MSKKVRFAEVIHGECYIVVVIGKCEMVSDTWGLTGGSVRW